MAARFTVVGLGEALFDVFPGRVVLGGAPLNVAVHAHQLAQPLGGRGVVVSRVGQDDLGRQLLDELKSRGMTTDYVQADPDRDTGKVYVGHGADGQPTFDIVRHVAWDWLSFDPGDDSLANRCEAVCFGSLAQREAQARNSIYRFLSAAQRAVRLFDVNLRQNYYDANVLRRSCELATAVKLNEHELPVVADLLGLRVAAEKGSAYWLDRQAEALLKKWKLSLVAVTRGAHGTALYTPGGRVEGEPVAYPPADGADAVGAGDACAAGLLIGLIMRWPTGRTVNLANHAGAYVASQPGATPALPDAILDMLK
jgi:fructokinase